MGGDDDRSPRHGRHRDRPLVSMDTFLVFARKKADDALTAIGTISDPGNTVVAAARARFGDDWLEMIAIPKSAAAWAIEEE